MRSRILVLAMVLLAGLGAPARALVVAEAGDGPEQETNPADDPGWEYVGIIPGITAVYLGNGWALTASHGNVQDTGTLSLPSGTWQVEDGSQIVLDHDPGANQVADLMLFRIEGNPALPALPPLPIRPGTPGVGDEVVMMGRGFHRGDPLTRCASSGWDHVTSAFPMHWGTNAVDAVDDLLDGGTSSGGQPRRTTTFLTLFDPGPPGPALPTPHEAQAADFDSGGGVFIKRAGTWELAGILLAIDRCALDPTAALRGHQTWIADLSVYRDQIVERVAPPVPATPLHGLLLLSAALAGTAAYRLRPHRASRTASTDDPPAHRSRARP